MRFSENRVIAWIVLVVVIVCCISLYGGGAMKNNRFAVQQIFTDGELQNGERTGLSIDRDLEERADKTQTLVSIASKYLPIDNEALTNAALASNMLSEARKKEMQDCYVANKQLTGAVENLYTAMTEKTMSEQDKLDAYGAYKEIKARADMIRANGYNSNASQFNHSIGIFPANIIARFTGVEPLPLFE